MNRSTFLSSLSFLKPLDESKTNDTNNQQHEGDDQTSTTLIKILIKLVYEKKCTQQKVLSDFAISIEPISTETLGICTNSLGPAYFIESSSSNSNNNETSFDPAMGTCDMMIYHSKLPEDTRMVTPIKDLYYQQERSLFGGFVSTMINNEIGMESILVLNIDGQPYQLNVHALQRIRLEQQSMENSNNKKQSLPQCLLLELPTCWLRIFSTDIDNEEDDNDALQTALEVLKELQKGKNSVSYPYPLSIHNHNNAEGVHDVSAINSSEFWNKTKERLQSHTHAWRDLEVLHKVLSDPIASLPDKTQQENFKRFLSKKLSNIPIELADSMIEEQRLAISVDLCHHDISNNHNAINITMDAFWKSTTNYKSKSKRRRMEKSHNSNMNRNNNNSAIIQQDCMNQTNELLKKHKEAVKTKYMLSTLPLRG